MTRLERVLPKYCENIIVAAVYKRHFEWYVAPKNLWKQDYNKLYTAVRELYVKLGRSEEQLVQDFGTYESFCAGRWGIEVLDSDTASEFFSCLFHCRYSADELRSLRAIARDDQKRDYFPALYIDFDSCKMYSLYPESENFEKFVPDGWTGESRDFTSMIPADKRF